MADRVYLNVVGEFLGKVVLPQVLTDNNKPAWVRFNDKGTPFLGLPLVVTDGQCAGHTILAKMYLSDAAFDNTIARLAEVFGFDGDLAGLSRTNFFADKPCRFTTKSESYTGKDGKMKTIVVVEWVNAVERKPKVVVEESKVKSLLANLSSRGKAVAKATLATAGAPKAAAPTPTPTTAAPATAPVAGDGPPESDDVPF